MRLTFLHAGIRGLKIRPTSSDFTKIAKSGYITRNLGPALICPTYQARKPQWFGARHVTMVDRKQADREK